MRSDRLRAKASEHAILLAEPTFQTREAREAVVTAMFEKQRPPAVFLAKNAVLASFATGRQTSLVVDAGHEGTTSAPRLCRRCRRSKCCHLHLHPSGCRPVHLPCHAAPVRNC